MEENKKNRITEIDDRIKGLNEHIEMWGKAGGYLPQQLPADIQCP